jgi:hypothetical protein
MPGVLFEQTSGDNRGIDRMRISYIAFGSLLAAVLSAPVQADDKLPIFLDRKLSMSAEDTCTPGNLWVGAGIPNATFQRKRNEDAGIELGIKGHFRQGNDIRSSYVDADGLIHIEVPAGPQPTALNRAAWNFTFSYDVSLDPSNPTLDQYKAELWIDLDPSDKTNFLKLDLVRIGPSAGACAAEKDLNGFGWKAKNTLAIPDDEGTDRVTQNSQNLAFYATAIDGDPNTKGVQPYTFTPGQFDVVMKIKRKSGSANDQTELHVVFDVVSGPLPTP